MKAPIIQTILGNPTANKRKVLFYSTFFFIFCGGLQIGIGWAFSQWILMVNGLLWAVFFGLQIRVMLLWKQHNGGW